jgi:hypothetical protein
MTAAAGAALLSRAVGPRAVALTIVVAGGLVEGSALGLLQGRVLARPWGPRVRRAWSAVTIVVAGLGWAAASAPSALSEDDGGTVPSWWLVILGATALGAAMGAVLGLAQAEVLMRTTYVRRPWRWVRTSTFGWAAAMPVIFVGASLPDDGWSAAAVLAMGPPTGLLAGTLLGLLTPQLVGAVEPVGAGSASEG